MSHDRPVLIDRFLEDAFEFDVDAVADSTGAVVIGGIMEHIEEAGIHSGDSSCVVPPFMVAERHLGTIREYTRRIARALKVVGLMNVQYAIKDDMVYVLEVNPRSSRTVPCISKATGVPMARIAARVAAGRSLAELGVVNDLEAAGVFVKSPVFPFVRFPGVDTILGPEMKSTGEVMGGADNFGAAFGKAMMGAGQQLPKDGCVFISVNNSDKPTVVPIARDLAALGFAITASRGTAAFLRAHGIDVGGDLQGQRGTTEHRRPDRERQDRSRGQHAARARLVLRRSRGPAGSHHGAGAVHHDAHGRVGGGQRHQSTQVADADGAVASGLLCGGGSRRLTHEPRRRFQPRRTRRSRRILFTSCSCVTFVVLVVFVAFDPRPSDLPRQRHHR